MAAGPPAHSPDAARGKTLAGTVASKISYRGPLADVAGPAIGGLNVAGSPIGDNFPISNLGEDQMSTWWSGSTMMARGPTFGAGLLPPWGPPGGAQVTTAHAHDGARSARLDGADNADEELLAGVEFPPDASSITLSYWWYVESTDAAADADVLTVVMEGSSGRLVVETLTNSSPRDAWHQTSFDVGSYAGGPAGVTFHAETNAANPTSFYLDDVQVQVCGAAAPGRRVYLLLIAK